MLFQNKETGELLSAYRVGKEYDIENSSEWSEKYRLLEESYREDIVEIADENAWAVDDYDDYITFVHEDTGYTFDVDAITYKHVVDGVKSELRLTDKNDLIERFMRQNGKSMTDATSMAKEVMDDMYYLSSDLKRNLVFWDDVLSTEN